MHRIATSLVIAICMLAANRVVSAAQAEPEERSDDPAPIALFVVLYPPQTSLDNPLQARHSSSPFTMFGGFMGIVGSLAGTALDSAIALARTRPAIMRMVESTEDLGASHDYHGTIVGGLSRSTTGTNYEIRKIEQFRFSSGISGMAKWAVENENVDGVLFIQMTFELVEDLDRLRSRADTYFYRRREGGDRVRRIANNSYNYVSMSRGDLFRPWDDGEREALFSMVEAHYEYKVGQHPQNERAYRKDRDGALRALSRRDVILPTMAVQEGWSQESFEQEMSLATDQIMSLIRNDLFLDSYGPADNKRLISFRFPNKTGELWTLRGRMIDTLGDRSTYRDRNENLYSVPPDLIDAE